MSISEKNKRNFDDFVISLLKIDGSLDEIIGWIRHHLYPQDVFDLGELKEWAEDNGYKLDPS